MPSKLVACVNGEFVPASQAMVSSFDFGFLYGIGLFETLRTFSGRLFALERHLARMERDAETLGWKLPLSPERLAGWVRQTVQANASFLATGQDLRIRLTVTPGLVEPKRGWWEFATEKPTVVIHATPLAHDFDARLERGWAAVLAPWRRPKEFPLWQFKTTAYFANVLARRYAKGRNAEEALWCNTDGNLTEGTATNLFLVCKGELWTAPPQEGLLAGVARSVVLDIAQSLGIPVREQPLPLSALEHADEAFLTNALIAVVPLTKIEDRVLPVGVLTRQLRTAYHQWARERGQFAWWM